MESQKPPPKYTSPKGMWTSKLILRTLMIIFGITILSLAGSIATSGIISSVPLLIAAPPGVLSLIWNVSEAICILTRGGHRGIHPGANVGLDLILWLALAGADVALWLIGVASSIVGAATSYSSYGDYGSGYDDFDDVFGDDLSNTVKGIRAKGQALLGLTAVLTILHFTTFVIACYETNVRNRLPRQTVIVMQPATAQPTQAFYPPAAYATQHQPLPGQQMYYPYQQQQAVYPPKAIEAYQGQQGTPPPPPVYTTPR
jgi:hypothetical protein